MSKGHPQLPRIQPVGCAAFNPPHPTGMATWHEGRGLTIVDTRKTYPMPTGLGHTISYLPAGVVTAADDARMMREYDPEREVVVGMLRANGDETVVSSLYSEFRSASFYGSSDTALARLQLCLRRRRRVTRCDGSRETG